MRVEFDFKDQNEFFKFVSLVNTVANTMIDSANHGGGNQRKQNGELLQRIIGACRPIVDRQDQQPQAEPSST